MSKWGLEAIEGGSYKRQLWSNCLGLNSAAVPTSYMASRYLTSLCLGFISCRVN